MQDFVRHQNVVILHVIFKQEAWKLKEWLSFPRIIEFDCEIRSFTQRRFLFWQDKHCLKNICKETYERRKKCNAFHEWITKLVFETIEKGIKVLITSAWSTKGSLKPWELRLKTSVTGSYKFKAFECLFEWITFIQRFHSNMDIL